MGNEIGGRPAKVNVLVAFPAATDVGLGTWVQLLPRPGASHPEHALAVPDAKRSLGSTHRPGSRSLGFLGEGGIEEDAYVGLVSFGAGDGGVEYGAALGPSDIGHQLDGEVGELAEVEAALGVGLHPGGRTVLGSGDVDVGVRDLGGDGDAGDGVAFRIDDDAGQALITVDQADVGEADEARRSGAEGLAIGDLVRPAGVVGSVAGVDPEVVAVSGGEASDGVTTLVVGLHLSERFRRVPIGRLGGRTIQGHRDSGAGLAALRTLPTRVTVPGFSRLRS